MIRRNTWVLLGVFVVVLAGAWAFQHFKGPAGSTDALPSSTPATNLINVNEKEIASLTLQGKGKTVAIGRDSSGNWSLTEPTGQPTDPAKVESAVSQLTSMLIKQKINPTTDLKIFGLVNVTYSISIVMNGGDQYTILVGNATPTGDGYYVKVNGDAPVVVPKYGMDAFTQMLDTPPFKDTPTPSVTTPAETGTPGALETSPVLSATPAASAAPTSSPAPTNTEPPAPTETTTPAP